MVNIAYSIGPPPEKYKDVQNDPTSVIEDLVLSVLELCFISLA